MCHIVAVVYEVLGRVSRQAWWKSAITCLAGNKGGRQLARRGASRPARRRRRAHIEERLNSRSPRRHVDLFGAGQHLEHSTLQPHDHLTHRFERTKESRSRVEKDKGSSTDTRLRLRLGWVCGLRLRTRTCVRGQSRPKRRVPSHVFQEPSTNSNLTSHSRLAPLFLLVDS
jgi:hypothetical protein